MGFGASSMGTHRIGQVLHTSDRLGLDRFVTMENHYDPVYRKEEREMLPLCERRDIRVIPWSPLAQGCPSRPHDDRAATVRGETLQDRHEYRAGAAPRVNEWLEPPYSARDSCRRLSASGPA